MGQCKVQLLALTRNNLYLPGSVVVLAVFYVLAYILGPGAGGAIAQAYFFGPGPGQAIARGLAQAIARGPSTGHHCEFRPWSHGAMVVAMLRPWYI